MSKTFQELLETKISRRIFIAGSTALFASAILPKISWSKQSSDIQTELNYELLIKWGDHIIPDHDNGYQNKFGYNNDYIAYMPINNSSEHGLLCVNHETTDKILMGGASIKDEMLSHGHSVIEVKKENGKWKFLPESEYNRRFNAYDTEFKISGPANIGSSVIGTVNNCAGGKTPWGTVLVCEENFNGYFYGEDKEYGIDRKAVFYEWYKEDPRFADMEEAKKFGWVWEYNPYDPKSLPVKRTALGRFKHEGATCVNSQENVVIYMGDDEAFQFLYKYIGNNLDTGTLYVAKFDENKVTWLPIPKEELVNTRNAARKLGATPMDRPEDIAVSPITGEVFVALTNNYRRLRTNAANPRPANIHGHIIMLMPNDHADLEHEWDIFMLGDENLSCPDNLTFDPQGRLWIATDGMEKSVGRNDGLFVIDDISAPQARQVLAVPNGAEATGPEFTPDGKTLFLSIQHPGEGSTLDNPSTRWPEFLKSQPPKPGVVAIDLS